MSEIAILTAAKLRDYGSIIDENPGDKNNAEGNTYC